MQLSVCGANAVGAAAADDELANILELDLLVAEVVDAGLLGQGDDVSGCESGMLVMVSLCAPCRPFTDD